MQKYLSKFGKIFVFAFFQGNKERQGDFLHHFFFTTKNSINLLPHAHVFWAWARILRINHSNLCKVIRKPQSRFAFLYDSWFFSDDWIFCKMTKMFWRTILTTPRVRPHMRSSRTTYQYLPYVWFYKWNQSISQIGAMI